MRISRRLFIGSGCASLLGLLTRPAHALLSAPVNTPGVTATDIGRVLEVLSLRDSAIHVGRSHLKHAPGEANPLLLYEKLVTGHADLHKALAGTDEQALRKVLSAQCRNDYAGGRIVTLDGWVLSVTEARICALAALTAA